MATTTFHSVIIVFWKETAFPRWRAMDRRWKRNSVSLVSSVTTVMRRPISCVTSMAVSCHAPAVSMANGQKMWVLAKLAYLSVLLLLLSYQWLITYFVYSIRYGERRLSQSLVGWRFRAGTRGDQFVWPVHRPGTDRRISSNAAFRPRLTGWPCLAVDCWLCCDRNSYNRGWAN